MVYYLEIASNLFLKMIWMVGLLMQNKRKVSEYLMQYENRIKSN
jgi:hypothetical protein